MPKFKSLNSKYLEQGDISDDRDLIVTIKKHAIEMVGQDDDAQEKWILYFDETDKGLALNKVNGERIATMFGREMDDWVGQKIALYVDHDVMYGVYLV